LDWDGKTFWVGEIGNVFCLSIVQKSYTFENISLFTIGSDVYELAAVKA